MKSIPNQFEQEIDAILNASFKQQEPLEAIHTTGEQEEGGQVLHVDKYTLPNGDMLFRLPTGEAVLVPGNAASTENPLDANAVESVAPLTLANLTTEENTVPVTEYGQQEETPQDAQPVATGTRRRVRSSPVLVPLLLLLILAAGAASYFFLLPLTATAVVTITPKVKSLHTDTTVTIGLKAGQVRGRPLESISFTKSETVPATGLAHDDATRAAGVLTFYNADSQSYTISAGTSFTVQGVTVVTDTPVTVQAAIPPTFGTAITPAHTVQAGTVGNIAAHTISTRCCGSQFVTATNTTPFSGGRDARSYSYIQSSDIHNAATDLLATLTPKTSTALQKQAQAGEQLVTALCNPRTQESAAPGAAEAEVTISVTQTCSSVAYTLASLQQVATSTLARNLNLVNYQQVETTQVTVNGSTFSNHTATLDVSLSGTWVYHFPQSQLAQLIHKIAGESLEKAKATLTKVDGVTSVSIHLQRLDFRSILPTDPQKISMQFFYIVS